AKKEQHHRRLLRRSRHMAGYADERNMGGPAPPQPPCRPERRTGWRLRRHGAGTEAGRRVPPPRADDRPRGQSAALPVFPPFDAIIPAQAANGGDRRAGPPTDALFQRRLKDGVVQGMAAYAPRRSGKWNDEGFMAGMQGNPGFRDFRRVKGRDAREQAEDFQGVEGFWGEEFSA